MSGAAHMDVHRRSRTLTFAAHFAAHALFTRRPTSCLKNVSRLVAWVRKHRLSQGFLWIFKKFITEIILSFFEFDTRTKIMIITSIENTHWISRSRSSRSTLRMRGSVHPTFSHPEENMDQLLIALQDRNLTLKAKGILAIMVLLGDQTTAQDLARTSKDGLSSTQSGIAELIERGHVERVSLVPDGETLPRSYLQVRSD
jgi:hypothetical protein